VVVHAADFQDQDGAEWVLEKLGEQFRRIQVVFGDIANGRPGLPDWLQETFGWILQTVLRPVGVKGFVILPKRCIVERTFVWLQEIVDIAKTMRKQPPPARPSPISP